MIGILLASIGYHTQRSQFNFFISQYLIVFVLYYFFALNKQQWHFLLLLGSAIGLRLILLFSAPQLSNDFYRFIWDGELLTMGINPYAHTPNELISHADFMMSDQMRVLYHGMGQLSQSNYSCYPVLNQLFFYFPGALSDSLQTQVLSLKIIMILADIGVVLIGRKILMHLKMNPDKIWFYAFNPLIILEFTGNLHFEGVMIFFLLSAFYLLLTQKWLLAAVLLSLSIQVKLIPLMLLPLFFYKLRFRYFGFVAMTAIIVLLISNLMLNETFALNLLDSVNSWFVSFQFNASIFYVINEIGWSLKGYDTIETVGPFLSKLTFIGILLISFLRKYREDADLFKTSLFVLSLYFIMSTTVHPWYIGTVLAISIFTPYMYGILWSALVMLSYAAYQQIIVEENTVLLFVEYGLLFLLMAIEIRRFTKRGNFVSIKKSIEADKIQHE